MLLIFSESVQVPPHKSHNIFTANIQLFCSHKFYSMIELKPINQMKIKRTITLLDDHDDDVEKDGVCVSNSAAHVHIKSSQPYRHRWNWVYLKWLICVGYCHTGVTLFYVVFVHIFFPLSINKRFCCCCCCFPIVKLNASMRACVCAFNNYCLAKLAFQLLLIILSDVMCLCAVCFVVVKNHLHWHCILISMNYIFYSLENNTKIELSSKTDRQIKSNHNKLNCDWFEPLGLACALFISTHQPHNLFSVLPLFQQSTKRFTEALNFHC